MNEKKLMTVMNDLAKRRTILISLEKSMTQFGAFKVLYCNTIFCGGLNGLKTAAFYHQPYLSESPKI